MVYWLGVNFKSEFGVKDRRKRVGITAIFNECRRMKRKKVIHLSAALGGGQHTSCRLVGVPAD